jgi:hypothetical protein
MTPDSIAQTVKHPLPEEWTEPMDLDGVSVPWQGEVLAHLDERTIALRGLEVGRRRLLAAGVPGLRVGDQPTLQLQLRGYDLWITAHVDRVALAGGVGLVTLRLGVTCPRGTDLLAELTGGGAPPRRADCSSIDDDKTAIFRRGDGKVERAVSLGSAA